MKSMKVQENKDWDLPGQRIISRNNTAFVCFFPCPSGANPIPADCPEELLDGLARPTTALRIAGLLPPSKTASQAIDMVKDSKQVTKFILKGGR